MLGWLEKIIIFNYTANSSFFLYIASVFNNIWRVSYWIAIFTNLLTLSRHLMYKITYNDSTCLHSHIIFVAITIFQMFVLISYWWSRLLLYLRHTFPLPSEWFPLFFTDDYIPVQLYPTIYFHWNFSRLDLIHIYNGYVYVEMFPSKFP